MANVDYIFFFFSKSWFLFYANFSEYYNDIIFYLYFIKFYELYFLFFYKADLVLFKLSFKSAIPSSIISISLNNYSLKEG